MLRLGIARSASTRWFLFGLRRDEVLSSRAGLVPRHGGIEVLTGPSEPPRDAKYAKNADRIRSDLGVLGDLGGWIPAERCPRSRRLDGRLHDALFGRPSAPNVWRNGQPSATHADNAAMNREGRQGAKIEPREEIDRCAHAVIGAAIEVHGLLGPGFLESVYEQAMAVELGLRSLAYRRQVPVALEYKGHRVGDARVDLVVQDNLIVELKAVTTLLPLHLAQALSYLKALGEPLALVINFNVLVLRNGVRRVVLSQPPWRLGDLGG